MRIDFVAVLSHALLMLMIAPLFTGVINRVKAAFAGRVGPSLFQPYYDLIKLFRKGSVYSTQASWIFYVAPLVVFAAMIVLTALVPLGPVSAAVSFNGDIFFIAYLLAFARFFLIIGALDTASSMDAIGAAREAFFSCFAELALFMNFVTLAMAARSFSLSRMIGMDLIVSWDFLGPAFLLVISSLFVLLLAENCRIPVDDPDTHLELTMIHEVMILDNSGVDLAYMLYAGALKLLLFAMILVPIITPFRTNDPLFDCAIFFTALLALAVAVGVVESCMARLKLNRVRGLLLLAFALAFFGFVIAMWRA